MKYMNYVYKKTISDTVQTTQIRCIGNLESPRKASVETFSERVHRALRPCHQVRCGERQRSPSPGKDVARTIAAVPTSTVSLTTRMMHLLSGGHKRIQWRGVAVKIHP